MRRDRIFSSVSDAQMLKNFRDSFQTMTKWLATILFIKRHAAVERLNSVKRNGPVSHACCLYWAQRNSLIMLNVWILAQKKGHVWRWFRWWILGRIRCIKSSVDLFGNYPNDINTANTAGYLSIFVLFLKHIFLNCFPNFNWIFRFCFLFFFIFFFEPFCSWKFCSVKWAHWPTHRAMPKIVHLEQKLSMLYFRHAITCSKINYVRLVVVFFLSLSHCLQNRFLVFMNCFFFYFLSQNSTLSRHR